MMQPSLSWHSQPQSSQLPTFSTTSKFS
jgi:hypothetical protein